MAQATLLEEHIKEGERLIRKLDDNNFPIVASFWFYDTDIDTWRLIIATRLAVGGSAREAYNIIQKTISKIKPSLQLSIKDITVVDPKYWLVEVLRTAIRTDKSINGIRFSHNIINNYYVEDAYIYRLT